jgi:N-methylhydantoinase B
LLRNVRTPAERQGDLTAQLAAHATGQKRLLEIVGRYGLDECLNQAEALIAYAGRMTRAAIQQIPDGHYTFQDFLDNDGQSENQVPIKVTISVASDRMSADFSGTAAAVSGNLNAVPAIVESAVAYCIRCLAQSLLNTSLPMNQGAFEPLTVIIEPGSLLHPHPPHAVAAGNVETSQRVVDVVFGALAQALPDLIPAASQGTMNNLTFGGTIKDDRSNKPDNQFAYYETIGGGAGAGKDGNGGSGIHVHMSNTRNTPVEAMEYAFPVRIIQYALRHNSGGGGHHKGGDGLIRTIQFLNSAAVTLVSERRIISPYGLKGA